jgi:hypothetical protein
MSPIKLHKRELFKQVLKERVSMHEKGQISFLNDNMQICESFEVRSSPTNDNRKDSFS